MKRTLKVKGTEWCGGTEWIYLEERDEYGRQCIGVTREELAALAKKYPVEERAKEAAHAE